MSGGADAESPGIEERLRCLESHGRRLRKAFVITLVAFVLAMVALARWVITRNDGRARFDTVEAEHFVVRDSLDKRWGELGMSHGMVRLGLGSDSHSEPGVAIGYGPGISGRSQIVLKDSSGAGLILTGAPEIIMGTPPGLVLSVPKNEPPMLILPRDSLRVLPEKRSVDVFQRPDRQPRRDRLPHRAHAP